MDKFYFCSGESAGSLEEFLDRLKSIDEDCFLHHVNEERNDFANWIREAVGKKSLARKVGELRDRDEIIVVVDKVVNSPAKVKSRIINQIKGAILDG